MGKTAVRGVLYTIPVIITLILSGITIIGSFTGHYNPAVSVIFPVLEVSLPILLILNILVLVIWIIARKWLALIPLFALLLNWNYLTAVIQFHEIKKDKSELNDSISTNLTLATYNVQSFGNEITGYSCKEIARYMQKEKADILCFQEFQDNQYFPIDSIRRILSHWQYVCVPSKDSIQGILPIAAFSRYPIIRHKYITYTGSSNCSMFCDIVVKDDTIRLINNHLQTTSVSLNRGKWERELTSRDSKREVIAMKGAAETLYDNSIKRATQIDSICRLIDESRYPVITCGDFNSLPSSYVYHELSKRLKDGFKTCGKGYMYTYRYYKHLLRIDYIFHPANYKGIRYYSPDLDLSSDHNPVLMKMKLK